MESIKYKYKSFMDCRKSVGKGKTALRLMEILADAGYAPDCLMPSEGYWRTAHADVYRWEVYLEIDGFKRSFGCWFTMTEFVKLATKFGFTLHDGEINPNDQEET